MTYTPITQRQIKLIHTLTHKAKLSDEIYRDILARYGAESCKTLSQYVAAQLIKELARYAAQQHKLEEATPNQKRLICALWYQVSRAETTEGKRTALNVFLANRFRIQNLERVRRDQVEKIVTALKAMGAEEQNNNPNKED